MIIKFGPKKKEKKPCDYEYFTTIPIYVTSEMYETAIRQIREFNIAYPENFGTSSHNAISQRDRFQPTPGTVSVTTWDYNSDD